MFVGNFPSIVLNSRRHRSTSSQIATYYRVGRGEHKDEEIDIQEGQETVKFTLIRNQSLLEFEG